MHRSFCICKSTHIYLLVWPAFQDGNGYYAWYLPSIRQQLGRQWGPGGPELLDQMFPVPEWAQNAIQAAVPRGTDYEPVDTATTQYLCGQITYEHLQMQQAQSSGQVLVWRFTSTNVNLYT